MGLDVSHGCWHGAYSAFSRWREKLAEVAGIPLPLMAGFWGGSVLEEMVVYKYNKEKVDWQDRFLPISWDAFRGDPLTVLLDHSDCDGEIAWEDCDHLADRLTELLPKLPQDEAAGHIGNWRDKTQTFIDGLRLAYANKENVDFH